MIWLPLQIDLIAIVLLLLLLLLLPCAYLVVLNCLQHLSTMFERVKALNARQPSHPRLPGHPSCL